MKEREVKKIAEELRKQKVPESKRREILKDSMKTKSSLLSKIQENKFISDIKLIEGTSAEEL